MIALLFSVCYILPVRPDPIQKEPQDARTIQT